MFNLYKNLVGTVGTKTAYMSRAHASSLHAHVFFMCILFFGAYSAYGLKRRANPNMRSKLDVGTRVGTL